MLTSLLTGHVINTTAANFDGESETDERVLFAILYEDEKTVYWHTLGDKDSDHPWRYEGRNARTA